MRNFLSIKGILITVLCLLAIRLAAQSMSGSIQSAEYFIDADPGQGNGTPIPFANGNLATSLQAVIEQISIAGSGAHTINIRIKNAANYWSPVFSSAITVLQPASNIIITRAEYFIDADPGQGNGTPMLAYNGNFNTALQTVLAGGINVSAGSHTINIRVLDNAGNWSPIFSSAVTALQPASNIIITRAEYFIDADPGQGNGTPMLAYNGNFNTALQTVLAGGINVSAGSHTINIRVLDNAGNWSPIFSSAVTALQPASNIIITRAEYFIDADPGQGNGTPMLAYNGNFNTALQTVLAGGINVSAGSHTINIRVLDNAGNWSPVFSSAITSLSLSTIQLTRAEYFWDTDPGQGNGNPILAIGGFTTSLGQLYQSIAPPPFGGHRLSIRVLDSYGNWSPVFSSVVYNYTNPMCDTISIQAAALTVCPGSPALITATVTGPDVLPGYGGGGIDGGNNNGGVVVNPVGVTPLGNPTVNGQGEGTTNTGDLTFHWQINGVNTGTNGPVLATGGDLTDSTIITCFLTSSSCPDTAYADTLVIRVKPHLYPAITIESNATTVCEGTEVNFFASYATPGTDPFFEWFVNGDSASINGNYFYPDSLNNGDVVTCLLVSDDPCAVTDTAWSNPIAVSVIPDAKASVSITDEQKNMICPGQTVEFTARAQNGGLAPEYFWYVDGNFEGSFGNTFYDSTLEEYDYVYCILSPSSDACLSNAYPVSDTVTIYVNSNCQSQPLISHADKKNKSPDFSSGVTASLFPNPSTGNFSIEIDGLQNDDVADIKIFNVEGQLVYNTKAGGLESNNLVAIDPGDLLAPGVYIVCANNTEFSFKQTLVIVTNILSKY